MERDFSEGVPGHVTQNLVDEVLGSASIPLPPHLVAHDHVDPEDEGRLPTTGTPESVFGHVGALSALPSLPLRRTETHRRDDRVALGLQPAQGVVLVELAVEVDATYLDAGLPRVGEETGYRALTVAPFAEVTEGHRQAKVRLQEVEGGAVIGAVGAPGLLRLNELRMVRVDCFPIVRDVVEVDGDVDGVPRGVGLGLKAECAGQRALSTAQIEMFENPAGVTVRSPSTGMSPRSGDGQALGRGPKNQVGDISADPRGKWVGESRGEKRSEPEVRLAPHPSISKGTPSPSVPMGRRVFLSEANSLGRGLTAAAAGIGVHTESSAAFPP